MFRTALTIFAPLFLIVAAQAQTVDPLDSINIPGITNYAPSQRTSPLIDRTNAGELLLDAVLTVDSEPLSDGIVWRIYNSEMVPGEDSLRLVAKSKGGGGRFLLERGDYIIHAAFGRATATKKVSVGGETLNDVLVLDAGGLLLDAELPDGTSPRSELLRFDVFSINESTGEHTLVIPSVQQRHLVRLPAGTYHVKSTYGSHNAEIRADLRVEPGKTVEATIKHQAAYAAFELVREVGGLPLADTAWSIYTPSGDIIVEHAGPSPSAILAAGTYTVIAENRDRIFEREVEIQGGADLEIEILATGGYDRTDEG
ncbi:MAG: hypothetical protein AAGI92_10425 [Pseudomonadota bacterium]